MFDLIKCIQTREKKIHLHNTLFYVNKLLWNKCNIQYYELKIIISSSKKDV